MDDSIISMVTVFNTFYGVCSSLMSKLQQFKLACIKNFRCCYDVVKFLIKEVFSVALSTGKIREMSDRFL